MFLDSIFDSKFVSHEEAIPEAEDKVPLADMSWSNISNEVLIF